MKILNGRSGGVIKGGGGGGQKIGKTFGEVLGPRRPTVSELHPAQKLGVK